MCTAAGALYALPVYWLLISILRLFLCNGWPVTCLASMTLTQVGLAAVTAVWGVCPGVFLRRHSRPGPFHSIVLHISSVCSWEARMDWWLGEGDRNNGMGGVCGHAKK